MPGNVQKSRRRQVPHLGRPRPSRVTDGSGGTQPRKGARHDLHGLGHELGDPRQG